MPAAMLKDIPASARPREKLLAVGPAALADAELVALLLRTGLAGTGVLQLAERLLATFGGLAGLLRAGPGELAPAMESRLLGLVEGSETSFALRPGEAFGERDPALVQRVRRAALDAEGDADGDYQVGDVVRFPAADGRSIAGIVRDVDVDAVVFDFNHPFAGRAVTFDVKLIGVL